MKRLGSTQHSEPLSEWTRVPMGTKFPTTQVLDELIYLICELYIDDVLIDSADEDMFVNDVRQVFVRFRKHKSFENPKKTRLGLEEVEYVGHLLSHKNVSFTTEKRQKIQNFKCPRTHKEMLMYIGLVNYIHDHVRNMNDLLRPLRKMVKRYDEHKSLEWSPELIRTDEESRRIMADCQQLFFKRCFRLWNRRLLVPNG